MDDTIDSSSAKRNGTPLATDRREEAARRVFENYVHRLKGLVRFQLQARIRNKEGTSALVQSVLASFFAAKPEFGDEDDLWPLLATMARRKAIDKARHFKGPEHNIDLECSAATENSSYLYTVVHRLNLIDSGPTPEEATIFIDLMESLPEEQVQLVQYRLEGYTYTQIACKITSPGGKPSSEKTIQRRFGEIRKRLGVMLKG